MIVYSGTPITNEDMVFNRLRALGFLNRRLSVMTRGSDTYFVKIELFETTSHLKQYDESSVLYQKLQDAGLARGSYWDHTGIHDDDDYPTLRLILFMN